MPSAKSVTFASQVNTSSLEKLKKNSAPCEVCRDRHTKVGSPLPFYSIVQFKKKILLSLFLLFFSPLFFNDLTLSYQCEGGYPCKGCESREDRALTCCPSTKPTKNHMASGGGANLLPNGPPAPLKVGSMTEVQLSNSVFLYHQQTSDHICGPSTGVGPAQSSCGADE